MNKIKLILIPLLSVLIYGCASTQVDNKNTEGKIADKHGGTPLFLAMIKGQNIAVDNFVSNKQYINTSRSDGVTPLMLAAIKQMQRLCTNLLLSGANINAVTRSGKYATVVGMTALMFAAENGHSSLVKVFIANKADIHLQDERGMTALMYAVRSKDLNTVMVLGEAGASYYHVANKQGQTATSMASHMGLPKIFKYLQKKNSEALADQFLR